MHGVIGAAIEHYIRSEFGEECWTTTATKAKIPGQRFEPMLQYDDHLLDDVLCELGLQLERAKEDILEDLGTFLVTNGDIIWLPRLLRFGGVNYADFIRQLPQVPKRVALAAFDFGLPKLAVSNPKRGRFELKIESDLPHWSSILLGLLRSMSDQYGTLCAVNALDTTRLEIDIFDEQHAEPPRLAHTPMDALC